MKLMHMCELLLHKSYHSVLFVKTRRETGSSLHAVVTVRWRARQEALALLSNPSNTTRAAPLKPTPPLFSPFTLSLPASQCPQQGIGDLKEKQLHTATPDS